eukprot:GAFH01001118.1.p1 GENE.GAFH01001118.1~~GAFH01001118.1.p1  ORF type:complete len:254 (-),score=42.05 GAFH01001118.1:776-1537(-)
MKTPALGTTLSAGVPIALEWTSFLGSLSPLGWEPAVSLELRHPSFATPQLLTSRTNSTSFQWVPEAAATGEGFRVCAVPVGIPNEMIVGTSCSSYFSIVDPHANLLTVASNLTGLTSHPGDRLTVHWAQSSPPASSTVDVLLYLLGAPVRTLGDGIDAAKGMLEWTVPSDLQTAAFYRMRVLWHGTEGPMIDPTQFSGFFTIAQPTPSNVPLGGWLMMGGGILMAVSTLGAAFLTFFWCRRRGTRGTEYQLVS